MSKTLKYVLATMCLALLPSLALAQSSIAGVVKDQSGAVMAGAKVVVSSDAMIEGSKSTTTNGEGRYEIIDLRPGTYLVTTTSAGFSTIQQTIILGANLTAPVDVTLRPGAVGETVTVEARVTTVDTENAAHNTTLSRSDLDALPTGRYMQSIASYAPGAHLNLPDIGGSQQIEQNYIALHGNSATQDIYVLDGLIINTTYSDGAIQQYVDNAAIQETTLQTSGITAETSGGGMMQNMVPRDGGNNFHATAFLSGSGGSGLWQSNNLNANTLARSLSQQDKIIKIEDFDGAFSGPIIKNKLWFSLTGRDQTTLTQAGSSTYPDGSPGIQDGYLYSGTLRLTYQMNDKNKFSAFYERNFKYKGHEILDGGAVFPYNPAVAAKQRNKWPMYYILQGKWTYTASAKLLLQTGFSISHLDYNDLYQNGIAVPEGIFNATEQLDNAYAGNGTGIAFTAGGYQQHFMTTRNFYSEQAAYITGNHQIKVGFQFSNGRSDYAYTANGDGYEVYTAGVPQYFVAFNTPVNNNAHLDADTGLYAMDTWKVKRLSLTAGIRWEYLSGNIDPENDPAGRFAPARSVAVIDCNTIKGLGCWKDWLPRLAGVYDVFGNHKTALKASVGKFDSQYATGFLGNFNPVSLQTETVTAWNTAALGASCNPIMYTNLGLGPNPACYATGGFAPQGTVAGTNNANLCAGCLGASPNPSFGAISAGGTGVGLDPNWHRDYNWQYQVGLQQELRPGVTLNVNWFRRSAYQTALVLNNNALPLSSWTPYQINNPLTGTPVTVFNLNPSVTAVPTASLYETNAPQSLTRDTYTGYEFQGYARLKRGMFATFGYTVERQLARNCADGVTLSNPLQNPNNLRYCDWFGDSNLSYDGINIASLGAVSPPWANNFVGNAVIPVKWGIVSSFSFLSNNYPGTYQQNTPTGQATTDANNGYLPRTIAISSKTTAYPVGCVGCQTSLPTGQTCATASMATVGCPIDPGYNSLQGATTVNLLPPGAYRTPRLNQLDISIKRTFHVKEKYTFEPTFQLFNLLNSNAAITQSTTVGSTTAPFLTPQQCSGSAVASNPQCGLGGNISNITNPRIMKLALIIKF